MAQLYQLEIQAQPGIYQPKERSIQVYFTEPEGGVKEDTGILLLLAGYGGHSESKVFTKMRQLFADQCNYVVVQCDYFGYEYMQSDCLPEITAEMLEVTLTGAELELLNRDYDKYSHILNGKLFKQKIELQESQEYFNDMGLMQAMDNLRAVKVVLDIIESNGLKIDENRIYAYGFSHGAYLAYLCNALCPGMFTAIIDNSAYIIPYYLKRPRTYSYYEEGVQIKQFFYYKALEYVQDEEILDLSKLYQQFRNRSEILCYAGEDDWMTSLEAKKAFLNQVDHVQVETITKYRVDNIRFTTSDHGLGADFIALFRSVNELYLKAKEAGWKKKKIKHKVTYEDVVYETEMFRYEVKWEDGVPVLYRITKE